MAATTITVRGQGVHVSSVAAFALESVLYHKKLCRVIYTSP